MPSLLETLNAERSRVRARVFCYRSTVGVLPISYGPKKNTRLGLLRDGSKHLRKLRCKKAGRYRGTVDDQHRGEPSVFDVFHITSKRNRKFPLQRASFQASLSNCLDHGVTIVRRWDNFQSSQGLGARVRLSYPSNF